jgi:RHH-type proline utilization regulon transcriptional repressor/proline dehydrogenase/delta 1-pyrroline-5-carboxylate dehydrogenase
VVEVSSIKDMHSEVFGPVLHVAKFRADQLSQVIADVNESNYGLTFGLHTRIDSRVEMLVSTLNVGNLYVNRDQIGAVVGSQPFGGENLSGTGPKAGGPGYVLQFMENERRVVQVASGTTIIEINKVQYALDSLSNPRVMLSEKEMPGPTGESNKLYEYGRGPILCLGADLDSANEQAKTAKENGCEYLIVCPGAKGPNAIDGFLPREFLTALNGFSSVALWSEVEDITLARRSLALREGPIIQLVCGDNLAKACRLERHVCVDTTAAGGNATLLASAE